MNYNLYSDAVLSATPYGTIRVWVGYEKADLVRAELNAWSCWKGPDKRDPDAVSWELSPELRNKIVWLLNEKGLIVRETPRLG